MATPPPPGTPPNPGGGRLSGANNLQRSIDALTRAMTASSSSWTRLLGQLASRGGHTSGSAGHGGAPTFGMSPSAQAQWAYRLQQMQRMHASGMQDATDAHRTARATAQRGFQIAQAQWSNQQQTIGDRLATATLSPEQRDALLRRSGLSNQQYASQNALYQQRMQAADAQLRRSRDRLGDQRDRLQQQYQTVQDRQAEAAQRDADRRALQARRTQDKMLGGIASAAAGGVSGMAGRFSTGIRDFNAGVDQYGRTVSLYGGFGRGWSGGYGERAQRATGQGFRSGLQNVAASDTDLFTGMSALYRQNNFANMPAMQRAAAGSALVSPEMGVSGAAQMQAQMGTAKAYYAGQMFGLAPSIRPGGGKATPQQTFASLFSTVSPKDLGQLTPTQMKAMLAQGGSLQTTLENYAQASGLGPEGVQSGADYLTLSNKLRARNKNMSQADVDKLLGQAAKSGDEGDEARDKLKKAAPGVAESYIDTQRRAEGAKREGKLDSSASYLTAAISAANTLIDIRELLKPILAPIRKFFAGFSGAGAGGGTIGKLLHMAEVGGYGLPVLGAWNTVKGVTGLGGGDSGTPVSEQGGSITQPTSSKPGSGANAAGAISFAKAQLGEPYVWGAEGPDSWDCSSLVQAAYKSIGIKLPRVTSQQVNVGKDVDIEDVQPGDLLFYPDVSHVVMSIGDGKVIQAPHTGDVVKISQLNPKQYGRVKRIVGSVGQLSNDLSDTDTTESKDDKNTTSAAVALGGAYGSTEEVDAVAAALSGAGTGQQTTETGLTASTQNTDSAKSSSTTTTSSGPSSPKGNAAIGKQLAEQLYHWSGGQWGALYQLWQHESGWSEKAVNPSSKAWGVPQALPGSKMASEGPDWKTNAATQIKWGLKYIKGRYKDPESAWAFWQHPTGSPAGSSTHWYDAGAWEIPDDQHARLHKGEMVLEKNTAHTVRQALLKDSLRTTDPGAGPSAASGGSGQVHLNFDPGSIVITLPSGTTEGAAQSAARRFVDYVTADDRVRQLMGGY